MVTPQSQFLFKMLSRAVLDTFGLILRVGWNLRAFPFHWDSKRQVLVITKSKRFLATWYVSIAYILGNTIFMGIRLGQAVCCMNLSYGQLFINLFNVITWMTGTGSLVNTFFHLHDLVHFINQLFKTNRYFKGLWRDSIGHERICATGSSARKFTFAIYLYSFVQFFIALNQVDKNPKYMFTLTGIQGVARCKLIPFAIFECFMSYHIATVLLFYVILFVAYVNSTSACLEIVGSLEPPTVPKHYRMLQVVNAQFNMSCSDIVMPFIFFTVGSINVLANYACIRLYGEVKMPGYLGFPLVSLATTFIIFDTFPSFQIFKKSDRLIKETRMFNNPKSYRSKSLNSCRQLTIRVNQYFIVKQTTLMTYLRVIIDDAILLLLTF